MSHRFTALAIHLIFSTKQRFPFLDRELAPECHAYLGGILDHIGRKIITGGAEDHVHLLFDMPATLAVADCIRTIKTNSSKWVHEKWPRRSKFAWQQGYAAFSVSRSAVPGVIHYIEHQEEHHRRLTYQEESASSSNNTA